MTGSFPTDRRIFDHAREEKRIAESHRTHGEVPLVMFDEINFAHSDIQSNAIDVIVIKLLANKFIDSHETNLSLDSCQPLLSTEEIVVDNALDRLTQGWKEAPVSEWLGLGSIF